MPVVSSKMSATLATLLNELKEECLSTVKLINQLELETLSDDQIEEVLGELIASVTHLKVHSGMVKEELEKD
ncbi:MAG: hypothetical protein IBX72_13045 [Nitrospirae bacterium]|nr:hypothetical protein [Nitrospirota bacterium]